LVKSPTNSKALLTPLGTSCETIPKGASDWPRIKFAPIQNVAYRGD
jgi:hypothetical protein